MKWFPINSHYPWIFSPRQIYVCCIFFNCFVLFNLKASVVIMYFTFDVLFVLGSSKILLKWRKNKRGAQTKLKKRIKSRPIFHSDLVFCNLILVDLATQTLVSMFMPIYPLFESSVSLFFHLPCDLHVG